jgi:hypothetical protein
LPAAWYDGSLNNWNCVGRVRQKIRMGNTTMAQLPRYPSLRSATSTAIHAPRAMPSRMSVPPDPVEVPWMGHTAATMEKCAAM